MKNLTVNTVTTASQANAVVPKQLKSNSASSASSQRTVLAANASKGYDVHVPTTNVDNAVHNAQNVPVNITSGTIVKNPDGTVKYQTSSHTQNAINVHQGAMQNQTVNAGQPAANAESQVANDYNSQANNINKTVDQAKQNVQNYENQVNQVNKENQQTVDTYNGAKAAADSNNAKLSQQAQQAKNDGVNVTQNGNKTVNTADQANSDYDANSQAIAKADAQQKQYNADYQKALAQYNSDQAAAKQENQTLDNAINQAKSAGINVVVDSNQNVSTVGALQSDYSNQANSLTSAVNQYNAQKQAYEHDKKNLYGDIDGVDSTTLEQKLQFNKSPNATMSYDILQPSEVHEITDSSNWGSVGANSGSFTGNQTGTSGLGLNTENGRIKGTDSYCTQFVHGAETDVNGAFLKATYTNVNWSYNGQKIAKVVATFSNWQALPQSASYQKSPCPFLYLYNDPTDTFWDNNAAGLDVTYQLYDANGNLINLDNNAYITVLSLNNSGIVNNATNDPNPQSDITGDYRHVESATLLSNGKAISLKNSSVSVENGKTLVSNIQNNYDPGLSPKVSDPTYPGNFNQPGWDVTGSKQAYWGAGVFQVSGDSISIHQGLSEGAKNSNNTDWFQMTTTIPETPQGPQAPTVHVHHDTLTEQPPKAQHVSVSYNLDDTKFNPNTIQDMPTFTPSDVTYHYDDINVTPVVSKNVDVGTVQGNNGTSVNGQQVVAGQAITFPLTAQDLPANRTTKTTSDVIVDTLDPNFNMTGWKAYLPGTNQDVSSWYKLTQKTVDGKVQITLTGQQGLLDAENAHMDQAFKMPIVDIYGTAKNAATKINNTYTEYLNNNPYNSNTVTVTTPKPTNPNKTVENQSGANLNGQFVNQGQTVTYTVGMDLSSYKNVVLDNVEANKGLGWWDQLDPRMSYQQGSVVVRANGKTVDPKEYTVTDDKGKLTVAFNNPANALKEYAGDQMSMTFKATVNQDITGNIDNTAYNNTFGNEYPSNKVTIYVPNPHKDVNVGTVKGQSTSIDGKNVIAGQAITFPLTTTPLPAGRNATITSYQIVDPLDPNFDYKSFASFEGSTDISKDWTATVTTQNGKKVLTLSATKALIDQMNADKSKAFNIPVVDLYGTAVKAGVTINNQYTEIINNGSSNGGSSTSSNSNSGNGGGTYHSNTVTIHTPAALTPVKTVDNDKGQDLNGQFVSQGQTLSYSVGLDLTKYTNVAIDSVEAGKGLGWSDQLDKRISYIDGSVVVTANENGKVVTVPADSYTITDNAGKLTVAFKDPAKALATYAGDKLTLSFKATVNKDISGDISNQAYDNVFGNEYPTNKVDVFVPNPHKDVQAGIVQGSGNTSIDGKTIVAGQTITFPLTTSDLPAGRKTTITSYQIVDKLDNNFDYDSFQSFLNDNDVTGDWTPSLKQDSDGSWVLTLSANKTLLDQMNADKSKAFTIPTVDLYGKAKTSGVTIKNSYTEIINNGTSATSNDGGGTWTSNTVSVNTTPAAKPTKTVDNANGQDVNDKNVLPGDVLDYNVSLDLSGLKNISITPDTIAKGLGIIDNLPAGVTETGVEVKTADGKDITNEFNITNNGQSYSVMAKDPLSLIRTYGDTKLDVEFLTKVNDNFTGDLTNQATQNTFGNMVKTNIVVDHVQPINPKKDVCLNVGDQASLNNQTLQFGKVYNYKLHVSRPANYGGVTKQMDIIDDLPKQADYTGETEIFSDGPITLADGTVLPKGSNITKYFTISYDPTLNEIKASPTSEFLKIINSAANDKNQIAWDVYVQFKVNGYGKLVNTFKEIYNGDVVKSNTVVNNVPEPKKPTPAKPAAPAPKAPTPAKPAAPVKPVASAPEPAAPAPVREVPKAVPETVMVPETETVAAPQGHWVRVAKLPQTGEENNNNTEIEAIAALGAAAMAARMMSKKKLD